MMSTDIYAPSLPYLPDFFTTSPEMVKLTMSINVFAYALATLIHGPLSERYGRRPVLLGGMICFTISSFFCAVAGSVEVLILARAFQGMASAAQGVVVLTIIRDLFEDREQVKYMAIYETAIALTPAIAPIIGAYVHIYLGWRANFYILTGVALIVTVLIHFHLQESNKGGRYNLSLKMIAGDYFRLASNMQYLRYVFILGVAIGFFIAFATAGPFILITQHGLPTQAFGYMQGLMVIAYIAGAVLTSRMVHKVAIQTLTRAGMLCSYVSALVLLLLVLFDKDTVTGLAISLAVFSFGAGPIFATCPTLAMSSTDVNTGNAAAMLVALEMGVASLAALSVGVFHDGSSLPFAMTTAVLMSIAVLLFFLNGSVKQALPGQNA